MMLKNSVVLVTGANRGIGEKLTSALVSAGASRVYAACRNPNTLSSDGPIVPIALDVTDNGSVEAVARRASDVTCVINNAGVLDFGDILTTDWSALERNLAVNLYGKLRVARAFVPVLESNKGGAIVNILTLVALASMPGLAVYNASKAAAWSMALSLRATVRNKGIDVHNVFPGAVDTDMLAGVEMDKTSPDDVAQAIVAGVEAGREDIFPDPMSRNIYQAWAADHKAVERQFASM